MVKKGNLCHPFSTPKGRWITWILRFCFYGLGSHKMNITMKPPFGIICFLTFVQGILEKAKSKIRYIQGIVGYTPIPTYPYWKSVYKPYSTWVYGHGWKNPQESLGWTPAKYHFWPTGLRGRGTPVLVPWYIPRIMQVCLATNISSPRGQTTSTKPIDFTCYFSMSKRPILESHKGFLVLMEEIRRTTWNV